MTDASSYDFAGRYPYNDDNVALIITAVSLLVVMGINLLVCWAKDPSYVSSTPR